MQTNKLSNVINKVEDVKLVMHENIERAAQNCVKLETMNMKAEELMQDAGVFHHNAKKLKDKMWWKNVKMWSIMLGIFIIIIAIILCVIYSNSSNNSNNG